MKRLTFERMLVLMILILSASGCTTETRPENQSASAHSADAIGKSRRLAMISPTTAQKLLQQVGHDSTVEIAKNGHGAAFIEPVDGKFRVVHNGRAGKAYYVVGDLAVSSDGKRVAYVAHLNDTFRKIVVDDWEGPPFMTIGTPVFSPDGKHLVYTITQDKKTYLVVDNRVLYEYQVEQDVLISPDSQYIVFAVSSKDGANKQLIISDFSLQDRKVFDFSGEAYIASDDHSRIAVVCTERGARSVRVLDVQARTIVSTIRVPIEGKLYHLRFSADNRSFACGILTSDYQRFILYNGQVERVPAGDELLSDPLVLSDPERVGVIIGMATKARLYTAFHKSAQNEKAYGFISDFVVSRDGRHHAYVAINAGGEEQQRVVVDGNEGPKFDKIVSPVFSPDDRFIVYRARLGGKRFLVVSDFKGSVIRQHANYDMVFQPVFSTDGKSIAYGVLDGTELWWKVEKL